VNPSIRIATLLALAVGAVSSCSSGGSGNTTPNAQATTSPAGSPTPDTSATSCALTTKDDLIAWFRAPGTQDTAQVLGDVDLSQCKPTVDTWNQTSPHNAGFCSILAKAKDNSGYNADASPATRPKHPIIAIGPAC